MSTETAGTDSPPEHRAVLVILAEAIEGEEVREAIAERTSAGDELFLVAPALTESGLDHAMGDIDEATVAARERLERSSAELANAGLRPERSEVGDSDLRQAISDALQTLAPAEIIIVAHRKGGPYHERDWITQAEREFEPPITELFVERSDGAAHVADVERLPEGHHEADPEEVEARSHNFPPFSRRDVLGIIVAIVGTVVLTALAAAGSDDLEGLSAQSIAILIAGGMALINLAHVIGLTLFQAGPYRGPARDAFARLSLIGTPIAIVACALLVAL